MLDQKLLTLIEVEKQNSFSKAGRALSLTQPAVSTHIKELEKELNCKLFLRTQEGLKITEEGLIAVKFAKRLQAIYSNFNSTIENSKKNLIMVNMGVTHTAESSFAVEALAKYANEKPSLRITFITGSIKSLYD